MCAGNVGGGGEALRDTKKWGGDRALPEGAAGTADGRVITSSNPFCAALQAAGPVTPLSVISQDYDEQKERIRDCKRDGGGNESQLGA